MNYKPIIITAGEPNSIFLEIFFKTLQKNNFKKPIILIVSKKLLLSQMRLLKFNFSVNLINENNIIFEKLNNKKINIIDINFKFKKPFSQISDKSNEYIEKCFQVSLKLLKTKKFSGMINGPISKKNFLKENFLVLRNI